MLNITTQPKIRPPRILLYGVPGIGKTTMGSRFPDALLIPVEDGADALSIARTDRPLTWDAFLSILDELATMEHSFKSLIIDSLSALQELLFSHLCQVFGVKSVELAAGGFGNWVSHGDNYWREMIAKLDVLHVKGLIIVGIGHSATLPQRDPRVATYDRMQPRLFASKKGQGMLPHAVEWFDVVACCAYEIFTTEQPGKDGVNKPTRGVGEGQRIMYLQERPAYLAKNRYGLPESLDMDASTLLAAIKNNLKQKA